MTRETVTHLHCNTRHYGGCGWLYKLFIQTFDLGRSGIIFPVRGKSRNRKDKFCKQEKQKICRLNFMKMNLVISLVQRLARKFKNELKNLFTSISQKTEQLFGFLFLKK